MGGRSRGRRGRGAIDRLPNGSLRVRVSAGLDPVTKRRHRLVETVPAGPRVEAEAEKVLTRLLNEVDERRNPKTKATVEQLLDRYLDRHFDGAPSTRNNYRRYARKHVLPFIGGEQVGAVEVGGGESGVAGRTSGGSTAAARAAERAGSGRAARCGVGGDADWGALVWTAMTTGVRRGELCALCWQHVDLDSGVVHLKQAVAFDSDSGAWLVKDTKTHQQRRIAIDVETTRVLADLRARHARRAELVGSSLGPQSYVFASDPGGGAFANPDSVSQRYERTARKLGIVSSLHKLRHYSATELIAAGVDPRTVAGRLGHAGGDTTTLRVYSAWVSEADQRASTALFDRVPERPEEPPNAVERAKTAPEHPYERVAADLRSKIATGELAAGTPIPTLKRLMSSYDVAAGTANRAVSLLKRWGLVESGQGRPTTVHDEAQGRAQAGEAPSTLNAARAENESHIPAQSGSTLLEFEVRRLGHSVSTFRAEADPSNAEQLRKLLVGAVRRDGGDGSEVADYELDVRRTDGEKLTTFVALEA